MEPVPAKSEPVQFCGCVGFYVVVRAKSKLPPKQSAGKKCGTVPAKSELPPKQSAKKIMWKIWRELVSHYFPADCFGIDFF